MSSPLGGNHAGGNHSNRSEPNVLTTTADEGWRRLNYRMIIVDSAQLLGSLVLLIAATVLSGRIPGASAYASDGGASGGATAIFALAAYGAFNAATDAYRWATTKYRVTDDLVERVSGLVVRSHRSVQRDRIRSVDIHAKIRHRLGGLRVISIGAGQQSVAGESAFDLDSVSIADAHALREILLHRAKGGQSIVANAPAAEDESLPVSGAVLDLPADSVKDSPNDLVQPPSRQRESDKRVLATFMPSWVIFSILNPWAYVTAVGVIWGFWWTLPNFGIDPNDLAEQVNWRTIEIYWLVAAGLIGITIVGAIGLAVSYFIEYGKFELARIPTDDGGSVLRTRHGLLTTREVARDDARMRGVEIAEPLWLRWIGAADAAVVTTGLNAGSVSQPAAILPRGPLSKVRFVASKVLDATPNPLDAALRTHPRAALKRRVWRAHVAGVVATALSVWSVVVFDVHPIATAGGVALWVAGLCAAVVSYRALGHAVAGDYLVVRSGLAVRSTVALQRSAVSTIAIRETIFQRRRHLQTVAAMTSAGSGGYEAIDVHRDSAVRLALDAAPGVLSPFVDVGREGPVDGH